MPGSGFIHESAVLPRRVCVRPDPFLQALPANSEVPDAVRKFHSETAEFTGLCSIQRGTGWLTSLSLWLGGFPPGADTQTVRIRTKLNGQEWEWFRDFGGHETLSHLVYDADRRCVKERIGGLTIWMRPQVRGQKLHLNILRLTLLGVPCPNFLLPRSATVEWQDDQGRFRFDVSAEMPMLGQLIRYRGWLMPVHVNRNNA
ncbi:DUF4166 domain-containing protein [Ruegeria faecimaris]|uniref:DUF4166 domain-containing protein n=1 Tax=Ruegeria faecimaris TaxID=686389 RepID=UPI0031E7D2D4